MSASSADPKSPIEENAQLVERAVRAAVDEVFRRLQAGERSIMAEYLSPREVREMCGVSEKTLEAMRGTRSGPPYFKIGNRVRYRIQDIRDYIEKEGPIR